MNFQGVDLLKNTNSREFFRQGCENQICNRIENTDNLISDWEHLLLGRHKVWNNFWEAQKPTNVTCPLIQTEQNFQKLTFVLKMYTLFCQQYRSLWSKFMIAWANFAHKSWLKTRKKWNLAEQQQQEPQLSAQNHGKTP